MQINKLSVYNYRNLKNCEINFFNGMNVICGENAQGKTNIIEALWIFTGAKSFKGGVDSSFIKFGCEKAAAQIEFISGGTENTAKMEFGEKRKAFFNGKALQNPSKLAGNFNAIVFSPDDLSIVSGGPEKRRRFIDVLIGQIYPQYIDVLRGYLRAVKQRNEIIKEYKYDSTVSIMLDAFEKEISEKGKKITEYRQNYINALMMHLPAIFKGLTAGKEEIMSVYVATVDANMLTEALRKSRETDKFGGFTTVGPHRDDIEFKINGVNARNYGSQGQKRCVALALKLASAEVIKNKTGEYPVCLLDDVMSELDINRQNYILNHIKNRQSFITCCDPSNVERLNEGNIIEVKNGEVI